ncbi:hypothetical protein TrVE_jg4459 [Triparma verrucosa]|uniref:Uncharacterized protein n=1 Tax=Triparma verrucosa TaxID=1606542 RepID=A0A9W7FDS4_9STRA|nr:hypothetical protein TrVE_jg4459 [Triparma verrucosa]
MSSVEVKGGGGDVVEEGGMSVAKARLIEARMQDELAGMGGELDGGVGGEDVDGDVDVVGDVDVDGGVAGIKSTAGLVLIGDEGEEENSNPHPTPSTLQMAYEMGACSSPSSTPSTSASAILLDIDSTLSNLTSWKTLQKTRLQEYAKNLEVDENDLGINDIDTVAPASLQKWSSQNESYDLERTEKNTATQSNIASILSERRSSLPPPPSTLSIDESRLEKLRVDLTISEEITKSVGSVGDERIKALQRELEEMDNEWGGKDDGGLGDVLKRLDCLEEKINTPRKEEEEELS